MTRQEENVKDLLNRKSSKNKEFNHPKPEQGKKNTKAIGGGYHNRGNR